MTRRTNRQLADLADLRSRCIDVVEGGCWTFGVIVPGQKRYGRAAWNNKRAYVHRIAYAMANGSIPDGMTVDHLCFNTMCVNPAHLQLLSPSENSARQQKAIAPVCRNGHPRTPENHYLNNNNRSTCRVCVREKKAADRLADPEGTRAKDRAHYERNKEAINARQRAYKPGWSQRRREQQGSGDAA